MDNIEFVILDKSKDTDAITFQNSTVEMLRIDKDAFYVRGKLVPIDEEEALAVYKAFRTWLITTGLTS
jgi:hypothetical protein